MLLKTRQVGDPVLRKQAQLLSAEQLKSAKIQSLIDFMIETLRDNPGVGLAAPQVGESLAIIIIEDLAKYHKKVSRKVLTDQKRKPFSLQIIVNPTLKTVSKSNSYYFEGCLSVDGYRAIVSRQSEIVLTGIDRKGMPIEVKANGWKARILQHEIDHLAGIIYTDKMIPQSFMTEKAFSKNWTDKVEKDLLEFRY